MKLFEEKIISTLSGDTRQNAFDFAAFLKSNGMTVDEHHSQVTYKDKILAYMHIDGNAEIPGPWSVWPEGDFDVSPEGYDFDEPMKKVAWEHINLCGKCGQPCAPGSSKTLFGKEFEGICGSVMVFTDPGGDNLICLQKLLLMQVAWSSSSQSERPDKV